MNYGSFQSGAKHGLYRNEQPPPAKQGAVLKSKGAVVANAVPAGDWDYTLAGLSHINREKIDAIREAVKELEKAGYIVRQQGARRKGQNWGRYRYTTPAASRSSRSRTRLDLPTLENPTLDNPMLENPTTEKPTLENPTQLNKDISKN